MNQDPKPYVYKVNGRNDYYAVDPISTDDQNRESYHDAAFISATKNVATRVAVALNDAFYKGEQYGRFRVKKEEETEGYKNYPTAMVALWIHNNKEIYRDCANLALGSKDVGEFSNVLRGYVEESDAYVRDGDIDSPFSEFISYCLSMTDWYELAKEIWDEVRGNK